MKKLLSISLALILGFTAIHTYNISANEPTKKSACDASCGAEMVEIKEEKTNEKGNTIIVFKDGVEVEVIDDNNFIIRDYNNALNSEIPEIQPRGWVTIGKAILKIVSSVLAGCQVVQYLSGHDICRIVLSYIATPKGTGQYTYNLSGNYVAGKIPGCEPANSLPCNSGYWQYSVRRS